MPEVERQASEMRCGYCWRWTCLAGDYRALVTHQTVCPFVPKDTRSALAKREGKHG